MFAFLSVSNALTRKFYFFLIICTGISHIYEKFEVALIVYFCFAVKDLDIKRKKLVIQNFVCILQFLL